MPEFHNSFGTADLPPYESRLKYNTIFKLMRNLDIAQNVCKGIFLVATELYNTVIKVQI